MLSEQNMKKPYLVYDLLKFSAHNFKVGTVLLCYINGILLIRDSCRKRWKAEFS